MTGCHDSLIRPPPPRDHGTEPTLDRRDPAVAESESTEMPNPADAIGLRVERMPPRPPTERFPTCFPTHGGDRGWPQSAKRSGSKSTKIQERPRLNAVPRIWTWRLFTWASTARSY